MMQHALTVLSEIAKGVLRFGLDRLGDLSGEDESNAPGGLTVAACHPYGLRSRPRDPDVDDAGAPTRGAGLLLLEFGGGDEGGIPTQDERVPLTDEGKGGAQLYGWTGSAVSSVLISGDTGEITITGPSGVTIKVKGSGAEIGGAGAVAIARAPELQTWAAGVNATLAALVSAAGSGALASPTTIPPASPLSSAVAATKGKVL